MELDSGQGAHGKDREPTGDEVTPGSRETHGPLNWKQRPQESDSQSPWMWGVISEFGRTEMCFSLRGQEHEPVAGGPAHFF